MSGFTHSSKPAKEWMLALIENTKEASPELQALVLCLFETAKDPEVLNAEAEPITESDLVLYQDFGVVLAQVSEGARSSVLAPSHTQKLEGALAAAALSILHLASDVRRLKAQLRETEEIWKESKNHAEV
jgi:hypothetical protein